MQWVTLSLAASLALLVQPAEAQPQKRLRNDPPPKRVGTCAYSHVRAVFHRLQDGRTGEPVPDSGSALTFANGLYQVDYAQVEAVDESRPGDPVLICLISRPRNCPPGDDRGRIYTATNLRTLKSWTLPDSQHMCGGA